MFKKMNLRFKLTLLFLLVGLIPMAVIGILAYTAAEREIRTEAFSAMNMYAGLVDEELESYFLEREGDARVFAGTQDVRQSLEVLREVGGDTNNSAWIQRLDTLENMGSLVVEEYGYAFVFITDPAGEAVYSTREEVIGANLIERDYIQGSLEGRAAWSELFYSDVIHENALVVSVPVLSAGEVIGTVNMTMDQTGIDRAVHEGLQELGATADAYLIDADGLLLTNTLLGDYVEGAALQESIDTHAVDMLSGPIRSGDLDFAASGEYEEYRGEPVLGQVEVTMLGDVPAGLVVEIDVSEAFQGVVALRNMMIPIAGVSAVVIALIAFLVSSATVKPVQKVSDLTRELATGDFTVRADIKSQDEIGQMAANLNKTIESLSDTLGQVQESSKNVTNATSEISSGNQDLSQRTEEQASSLEEISSTMEEINSSLETTSGKSTEAVDLSSSTLESVRQGESVVKDMHGAMEEITRGSQEISDIIQTVNDIAFQTNLLALNAAVEAARAGEQGKGFAVVASEVRDLAGRSAKSAKEIENLIKESISRVDKGNNLMKETDSMLQEIVANTQKATDAVQEITAAMREQSSASGEIRSAIDELNQVTQQNASLVEEIASSSESMNTEALELSEKVSFFKIS